MKRALLICLTPANVGLILITTATLIEHFPWTRAILSHAIFQQPYEEGANIIPKLQTRKRRHGEVAGLAQGHTTERQSLDLNLQKWFSWSPHHETSVCSSVCHASCSAHPLATGHELCFYFLLCYTLWHPSFSTSEWAFYISSTSYFLPTFSLFNKYVLVTSWAQQSWLVSTVAASKALVALVCCPPFPISHPALLDSTGKKVKKYFQGLTVKGSEKLSTHTFTLPMKTQDDRAHVWQSLVLIQTRPLPSTPCSNFRHITDNKDYGAICISVCDSVFSLWNGNGINIDLLGFEWGLNESLDWCLN